MEQLVSTASSLKRVSKEAYLLIATHTNGITSDSYLSLPLPLLHINVFKKCLVLWDLCV